MKTQKTAKTKKRTTQTAEDIVSDSLGSGALSEVCEVTAVMRELDDKENDLVKEFVSRGCGCDFGPKKTPCSMLLPVEHYQSLRATITEMSHDQEKKKKTAGWTLLQYHGLSCKGSAPLLPRTGAAQLDE